MYVGESVSELLAKNPKHVLDTRGMVCPYPMIETRKLCEKLEKGEVAEILTDIESTAKNSIPLVCENLGLNYAAVKEGEVWRIKVEKK